MSQDAGSDFVPWYEVPLYRPGGLSYLPGPVGRRRRSDEDTLALVRRTLASTHARSSLKCSDIRAIVEGRI